MRHLFTPLEHHLATLLPGMRWFGAKGRTIAKVTIDELWPLPGSAVSGTTEAARALALIKVRFADRLGAPRERYLLPLLAAWGEYAVEVENRAEALKLQKFLLYKEGNTIFADGVLEERFCSLMLRWILDGSVRKQWGRTLRGVKVGQWLPSEDLTPRILGAEQTNTSIRFGADLVMKVIRKIEDGTNLDVAVTRYLTETAHFPHCAPLTGMLELKRLFRNPVALLSLSRFVSNVGDAWHGVFAKQADGSFALNTEKTRLLGQRSFEMHAALTGDGAFAPEKITMPAQKTLAGRLRRHAEGVFDEVNRLLPKTEGDVRKGLEHLLAARSSLLARLNVLNEKNLNAWAIRTHGDYHMGQVLYTGSDYVILDFEGEPARTLQERQRKQCPLRDVSGMIRSFHYATCGTVSEPERRAKVIAEATKAFLEGYFGAESQYHGKPFLPSDKESRSVLIDLYVLEKALYEVSYEINHRPDWVWIPLDGVLGLLR